MTEKKQELVPPQVVSYRRDELEVPAVFTGTPSQQHL
jgi:hypothetical protein